MSKINIQFTLFSAFYSPLIVTMAGGFLQREGLEYEWSISPPGVAAVESITAGTAHVVQSAPSQAFNAIARGESDYPLHFAQVNEMDGFFISARDADDDFDWHKLQDAEAVIFGGGQPNAMLRYACHKAGIDFNRIAAITPGGPDAIDQAFRAGQGQYVQQQGPYPQQLQVDGLAHVVAQVGPLIGPCAFSSLAASRAWLDTDMARAFTRAYAAARRFLERGPGGGNCRTGTILVSRCERGCATAVYRQLSAAGLLDAACRNHPRRLRSHAGRVRIHRPYSRAIRLRTAYA